jgi:hypothetical protein
MPTVWLDGTELPVATNAATWAELLNQVDDRLHASGQIVTGARFDGIDEPAFREPGVLARPLDELATVEVLSGTPQSLLEECVAEAVSSIPALCDAAVTTAARFRTPQLDLASQGLLELAQGVSTLTAIGGAVILASRGGADAPRHEETLNAGVVEMTGYIDALVAAHQARDWTRVADVLEHGVEPALRRWETLLVESWRP